MITGTLIPAWIGVTVGVLMMLIVAGHAMSLRGSGIPASRRRIRQANAGLIVVLIPLLTAGTSLVSPTRQPLVWMQVWIAAMLLLTAVIGFALLDMVNTARLNRGRKERLAAERAALEREATEALSRACEKGTDDAP
jgi:hypothetical protein